jgi:hypothetical protein
MPSPGPGCPASVPRQGVRSRGSAIRASRTTPWHAAGLPREAEQIYDRELLNGGLDGGPALRDTLRLVDVTLRRDREIIAERPATAAALAFDSLRQLDRLEAARRDIGTEA